MKSKNPEGVKTDFPSGMGKVAPRELENAGYTKLKQLTKVTEAELLKIHGVGSKAVGVLREALKAKGMSFASGDQRKVTRRSGTSVNPDQVDKFMDDLDHPFKAEVQLLRKIIKSVDKEITEEIKWNAPTFSYKGEYLVTLNLWEKKKIHLVFHNPMISKVKSTLLEGDYDHRRMAYFSDKKDIHAKKPALEKALKALIKLQK